MDFQLPRELSDIPILIEQIFSQFDGYIPDDPNREAVIYFLFRIIILIWIVGILNFLSKGSVNGLGIKPRNIGGLLGIICAPLIHSPFASGDKPTLKHLQDNTLPFLFLGILVLFLGSHAFWLVTVSGVFLGGFLTWLLGNENNVQVGLSGVIFCYAGFLLLSGWFEQNWLRLGLSLSVLVFYPKEIFLGLKNQGHLFGFLTGAIVAILGYWPLLPEF